MSRYLLALLIGVILSGPMVSAQVTTGTIAGVVQDSSGAVIPGVSVTVKNLDTGITRTITTDEGGRYTVPDLTLGNYEVQAQLPGFQTEVRSGITLTVGRAAVVNFALKVGQISEPGKKHAHGTGPYQCRSFSGEGLQATRARECAIQDRS